ncbi:hypothetical protein [Spiroplasma endosymbiont of Apeira syringaria]|uniref:hypothetical protein n=1 Tax=Spiroplasma endosymbiont of Apeira syringaria TaxID=3066307 RepID=UPI0030D3DD24
MQDIAVQFEKHCWIHSVSLFPPQVHVGRSPLQNTLIKLSPQLTPKFKIKDIEKANNFLKNLIMI